MRRRQRTLALISISCGWPVVILVVRVRGSLAVRRWLSLVGSVGVASGRAVTVLVTVMAVVTRWRVQGMSRSVLVGVKGVTVAAVNRDWWRGRGVVGVFIVVIRNIGNSWQSNSTGLGHLGQGALGQAVVGSSEVG